MHANAATGERQRDAAGADAELECSAVAGEIGEEVDDRIDDRWVEHLCVVVVPRCDALAEVVLGHQRTTPCHGSRTCPSWSATSSLMLRTQVCSPRAYAQTPFALFNVR